MENKINKQTNQQTDQAVDKKTDQQKNIAQGSFFCDKKELDSWLEQSQRETDEFYKYYWTPPKH